MCRFNKKNEGRRLDPCMENLIWHLNDLGVKTLGCCCGHGKYNMTIIYVTKTGAIKDLMSGEIIPRRKRFYKRDKKGYYYVPEVRR